MIAYGELCVLFDVRDYLGRMWIWIGFNSVSAWNLYTMFTKFISYRNRLITWRTILPSAKSTKSNLKFKSNKSSDIPSYLQIYTLNSIYITATLSLIYDSFLLRTFLLRTALKQFTCQTTYSIRKHMHTNTKYHKKHSPLSECCYYFFFGVICA